MNMATLDEKDSQTMADLLAKLRIEGEVSSLKDLQTLVKPKKTNIKKERFSMGTHEDEDEDDIDTISTVVPKLTWFCGSTPIPKGHVSFTAWKHEVEGLLSIYPQKAVVQAIRRSLKSPELCRSGVVSGTRCVIRGYS